MAPICQHFFFLDYYVGKALYLLLMISLILQHPDVFQWFAAIAIFVVVCIDFIHPCLFGAEPVNGEGAMVRTAETDKTIIKDLEKAEAEDARKRVKKPVDPAKTEELREQLETEGKSIVDEKSLDVNADKMSGTGTLKVRFQVTPTNKGSPSQKKGIDMAASLKDSSSNG